jgi:Putative silver efflux pump
MKKAILLVFLMLQALPVQAHGLVVSQIVEDQRTFDLLVRYQPQFKNNIETISSTLVDTPSGVRVPLSAVADIHAGTSPNTIRHESASRYVVVQANVGGADLGTVIEKLRGLVSQNIHLPPGYYIVYEGQFEAQEKATQKLIILTLLAIMGIYVLLVVAFGTARAAALVLVNLPLALIGGIWAIVVSGGIVSVGSLLGFITLIWHFDAKRHNTCYSFQTFDVGRTSVRANPKDRCNGPTKSGFDDCLNRRSWSFADCRLRRRWTRT